MALPRREDETDWLPLAGDADMELGAETALAASERFGRGVPPFAPAAC